MTINDYYNKLSKFKYALPILNDIDIVLNAINNYSKVNASKTIDYISQKYKKQLNEIGKFFDNEVIYGDYDQLYKEISDEDVIDELSYLYECLVMIGCVKLNLESSFESFINKLSE